MIKRLLAPLAVLALATAARAQTPFYVGVSSALYSPVLMSTGPTATRIDNWNLGISGQMLNSRTRIRFQVPSGKMNCGYSVSVTTPTAISSMTYMGVEYDSGLAPQVVELGTQMGYWCLMQNQAAGQWIGVHQETPFRVPRSGTGGATY